MVSIAGEGAVCLSGLLKVSFLPMVIESFLSADGVLDSDSTGAIVLGQFLYTVPE